MGTTFIIIVAILFIHWYADFVLQTDADAKGKSTSMKHLISHTFDYSMIWLSVSFITIGFGVLPTVFLWFAPITFVVHTLTDYCTSRLNSYLLAKGDTHNFFVSVGFDQFLHYVQLFATFFLILATCI